MMIKNKHELSKPLKKINHKERLQAYSHIQKFWCCYADNWKNSIPIPNAILQEVPGRE
jgi:hypothetical protein